MKDRTHRLEECEIWTSRDLIKLFSFSPQQWLVLSLLTAAHYGPSGTSRYFSESAPTSIPTKINHGRWDLCICLPKGDSSLTKIDTCLLIYSSLVLSRVIAMLFWWLYYCTVFCTRALLETIKDIDSTRSLVTQNLSLRALCLSILLWSRI